MDSFAERLSIRFDDDVPVHLFSVASGLDSAVVGESEVLGQVRRAWEKAQEEGSSGPILGVLFRHAVETGKRVRSETTIARGVTSMSHGAVALGASRRDGGLVGARVLVIGAGEMGAGVAQALQGHGVGPNGDREPHRRPRRRGGGGPSGIGRRGGGGKAGGRPRTRCSAPPMSSSRPSE